MAKKRAYAEWGRQPIGPVGIEYDHARAEGLVFFAPLSGAHGTLDLVKKQLGTRTGLEAYLPTQGGAIHHLFGTSNYAIYPELPDLSYTTPTTVAWTQEARSTSVYSTVLNIKATGATYAFLIYESGSDANYYFVVGRRENVIGPHTQFNTPAGALTDDRLSRFVLTLPSGFSTGSGARLWRDGVELTGTVSGVGSTFGDNTTADFRIGARDTGADPFEGLIGDLRIWSRVLPDGDAEDESTVPGGWKLYAKSRILVPVSAGGSTYPVTLTESTTTTDAATAAYIATASVAESITAADSLAAATTWVLSLTEAATAAESITTAGTFAASITEAASTADALTSAVTWARALTEAASASDLATAIIHAVAALTEAASASDSQTTGSIYIGSVTESASVADALTAAATLVALLTEVATASDAATSAATWVRLLTEPATAVDSVAGAQGAAYTASVTEVLAAAELLVAVLGSTEALDRYTIAAKARRLTITAAARRLEIRK